MSTSTAEPSGLPTATKQCPPWCATNHRREACHYAEHVTFTNDRGESFRVEITRDPDPNTAVNIYIDDLARVKGSILDHQLEQLPLDRARPTATSTPP